MADLLATFADYEAASPRLRHPGILYCFPTPSCLNFIGATPAAEIFVPCPLSHPRKVATNERPFDLRSVSHLFANGRFTLCVLVPFPYAQV